MLSLTNTALHLLILQLLLQTLLLRWRTTILSLLGLYVLPVTAGPEGDILCDAGGIALWAFGLVLLRAKFGPRSALGDGGINFFFVDCCASLAGNFDAAAVIIEFVRDCGLRAIFVDGCDRGGEGCLVCDGIGFRDIIGPVRAAVMID
jgi:hypothetical protein